MANKIVSVTYYQTLKDVFWPLRPERSGKIDVKKIGKICRVCQKKAKIRDVKMLKPFRYL